jgi:hypothetical protein
MLLNLMETLMKNHKTTINKIKEIRRFSALSLPFMNEFREYLKLLPTYDEELNVIEKFL